MPLPTPLRQIRRAARPLPESPSILVDLACRLVRELLGRRGACAIPGVTSAGHGRRLTISEAPLFPSTLCVQLVHLGLGACPALTSRNQPSPERYGTILREVTCDALDKHNE